MGRSVVCLLFLCFSAPVLHVRCQPAGECSALTEGLCTLSNAMCKRSVLAGIEVVDFVYKSKQQNQISKDHMVNMTCYGGHRNLTFTLLDDTDEPMQIVNLDLTSKLHNDDLHSFTIKLNPDSVFATPRWKFKVTTLKGSQKNGETLALGSITRVSEVVAQTFEKSKIKDTIGLKGTCNENVRVTVAFDVSSLVLRLYIYGVLDSVSVIGIGNITNVTGSISSVHLTSNNIVVSIGNSVYIGRYDRLASRWLFTKELGIDQDVSSILVYTPHTSLCLHKQGTLDLVVVYINSTRPHVFWSSDNLKQWRFFPVDLSYATAGCVSSIVLDGERKNVLLMVELDFNSVIVVYSLANYSYCAPFLFKNERNLSIQIKNSLVEVGGTHGRWLSENGGCLFKTIRDINMAVGKLDELPSKLLRYDFSPSVWKDKCLLTLFHRMYHILYQEDENEDEMDVCNADTGFYLYSELPKQNGVLIEKNENQNNKTFSETLTLSKDAREWIGYLVGKIVICPKYKISCNVLDQVNETLLYAHCKRNRDINNSIHCESDNWFLVKPYHRAEVASPAFNFDWFDQSVEVAVISNDVIEFPRGFLPQDIDVRIGGRIARDGFKGVIVDYYHYGALRYKTLEGSLQNGTTNISFEVSTLPTFFSMQELADVCPIKSLTLSEPAGLIYLDVNQTFYLRATLQYNDDYLLYEHLRGSALIYAFLSHVDLVVTSSRRTPGLDEEIIEVEVRQKHARGITSMVMTTFLNHHKCKKNRHVFKLIGSCRSHKCMRSGTHYIPGSSNYISVGREALVPVNYRPPSYLGSKIPLTSNIYNVDRSRRILIYKSSLVSSVMPEYKQCIYATTRGQCNCTPHEERSMRVEHSDCIRVAMRVLFKEKLQPNITLENHTGSSPLELPYTVSEINHRKDFAIEYAHVSGEFSLSRDQNSRIKFLGGGLFHFRIELVDKSVTFCNLETEFLVFVDKTPIPAHVIHIMKASTVTVFCGLLFAVFIYYLYFSREERGIDSPLLLGL